MAVRHKPRRGPGNRWIYPKSKDVLEECGMSTLEEYIRIRRQTIAVYVATHPSCVGDPVCFGVLNPSTGDTTQHNIISISPTNRTNYFLNIMKIIFVWRE
jgi:hypothetical protein